MKRLAAMLRFPQMLPRRAAGQHAGGLWCRTQILHVQTGIVHELEVEQAAASDWRHSSDLGRPVIR